MTSPLVILSAASGEGALAPIGQRDEVVRHLASMNTAAEHEGDDVLHGPGIRIELAPGEDPVTQMLLTITEEEIAWLVISRLAKACRWKILDPDTGRALDPPDG